MPSLSVFAPRGRLAGVFGVFSPWPDRRPRAAAPAPRGVDPRVAAAIGVALALETGPALAALAYRVDGAAETGRPSAWRAVMAPGTARLGGRGGGWR